MTTDSKQSTDITLFKANAGLSTVDLVAHGRRIQDIAQQAMKEGVHFGRIPGVPKPTLFKPGAELLCVTFGLRPDFTETHRLDTAAVYEWPETKKKNEDIIPAGKCVGLTHYGYKCQVVHFASGRIIGEGEGSCSNWEKKYRTLPWPDVDNTVKKMAQKRALVAAVLVATACSDTFTQDVEDMPHVVSGEDKPVPQEAPRGLCPTHKVPFVHKTGTSKAGKPYDFWACSADVKPWCQEKPADAPAHGKPAEGGQGDPTAPRPPPPNPRNIGEVFMRAWTELHMNRLKVLEALGVAEPGDWMGTPAEAWAKVLAYHAAQPAPTSEPNLFEKE